MATHRQKLRSGRSQRAEFLARQRCCSYMFSTIKWLYMWQCRRFLCRAAVFLQILRGHRTIVAHSFHSLQTFGFSGASYGNAPPKTLQWMLATRGTFCVDNVAIVACSASLNSRTCVDIWFWSLSGISPEDSDSPYFYLVAFASLQSFCLCSCVVWQRTIKNSAVDNSNAIADAEQDGGCCNYLSSQVLPQNRAFKNVFSSQSRIQDGNLPISIFEIAKPSFDSELVVNVVSFGSATTYSFYVVALFCFPLSSELVLSERCCYML